MSITLIDEDGTGLPNANALINLAYLKAYLDERGVDHSAYTDEQLKAGIVRGTDFMSESLPWMGFKLKYRGSSTPQSLAWPRSFVYDKNGVDVANDEVPVEVQKATAEVSWYETQNPRAMQPSYIPHSRRKSVKVGPISVTYDTSSKAAQGARPVLLAVGDLIGSFLKTGVSKLSGSAARR